MTDMARLLLMLGLAGTAVTFLGSAMLWLFNEPRRIRRALRRVLQSEPEAMIVAQGRGRGAGFSLASGLAAVAWDKGAWCLVYRLDEVLGAELIIDGEVIARVYRGEPRRALDKTPSTAGQVTLRLLLADAAWPDFELELWLLEDENRRDDWSPRAAIQEGNRWMARVDAIVRRPAAPRAQAPLHLQPQAPAVAAQPPVAAAPARRPAPVAEREPEREPAPEPIAERLDDDDDPPWDVDDGRLL